MNRKKETAGWRERWLAEIAGGGRQYFVLLSVCSLLTVIYKLYGQKQFSADGVGYFVSILETQSFFYVSWSRRFAEYLIQWPVVVATRLGVTDIPYLGAIYGIGIFIPYIVCLVICLQLTWKENRVLMLFPLASFLVLNNIGDYFIAGEYHVMALLAWPILFLLIKDRPLSLLEGFGLSMLLLLFLRLYETAILPGVIFAIFSGVRIFRHKNISQRSIGILALVLSIGCIVIATQFILEPRSLENRDNFIESLSRNTKILEVMALGAALPIFFLGCLLSPAWNTKRTGWLKNVLFTLALAPLVVYVFTRVNTDYAMTAYWSFSSRTLSGPVLPAMLLAAWIVQVRRCWVTKFGYAVFGVILITMLSFSVRDTENWLDFKGKMVQLLHNNELAMFVEISDTELENNHYRWSWNNALLSLVWGSPCIQRIVVNGDQGSWVYSPRSEIILKRYLRFDKKFKEIDNKVGDC